MDAAINCVLDLLKVSAAKAICYVFKVGANTRALKKDITQLKLTEGEISRKIEAAASTSDAERPTDRVTSWLNEVATKENMASELTTDYEARTKFFGGCLLNCWSGYRIGRSAFKMIPELKELNEEGKSLTVVTERTVPVVEWSPVLPDVPVFEPYLEKIRNHILENKKGMVGIWGMGGIGKSFLLKKLQSDQFVADAGFQYVIWITISCEPILENIQEQIAKRLNLPLTEDDASLRASAINHSLYRRNFLLLLDDIWSDIDLQSLGIPDPQGVEGRSQHVVFTSRSKKVCMSMGASLKFQVECLEWNVGWQLFEENLGEEVAVIIRDDEMLRTRAIKVAKKCGGLPLALKTIGRAMSSKITWREWQDAVDMLNNLQLPEMWGKDDNPFPLLKLSYNYLPDNRMKQCFLSCGLWPEDYPVTKEKLILSWMGQGFLDGFDNFYQAYNKGHTIIEEFKQLCLLEPPVIEGTCLMHDVIRGLALWIASDERVNKNKWLVRAGVGLKDAPETEKWQVAEKISLMQNNIQDIPQHPQCPKLTTVILCRNPDMRIPDAFVRNMPELKYLDAAFVSITKLPKELSRLDSLQYLDLSSTKIESLPEEMKHMTGLEYLILEDTYALVEIPDGLISSLEKLKFLNLLGSEYLKRPMRFSKILDQLEYSKGHKTFAATILEYHDLDRLHNCSKVSLWKLSVERFNGNELVLMPHVTHLQELKIYSCYSLHTISIMPSPSEEGYGLQELEVLELDYLPELESIFWKSWKLRMVLSNLRSLSIYRCAKLTEISWIAQLPQLEELTVENCPQMIKVISDDVTQGEIYDFPPLRNLKSLWLHAMPHLEYFQVHTLDFPCLEVFIILKCPQLKKLPFSSKIKSNKQLHITIDIFIDGTKEWWDSLEWEEDGTKSFFMSPQGEWKYLLEADEEYAPTKGSIL